MKKLTYSQLLNMVGEEVKVIDKTFDYPEQTCIVNSTNYVEIENFGVPKREYSCIELQNDHYEFAYDEFGKCIDGEFEVYAVSQPSCEMM